jgi:hypothetical protein
MLQKYPKAKRVKTITPTIKTEAGMRATGVRL